MAHVSVSDIASCTLYYPYFKHMIHYLPLGVYCIGDNNLNVPIHCIDQTNER